jgi:ATP-dependent DNA helicase RecG
MRTAQDLLSELNAADESPRIEAKRSREVGKSIIETVVAYAIAAVTIFLDLVAKK